MNDVSVLITGGAGVIGSHLAETLLARGRTVTVLDNFATGKRENLPEHHPSARLRVVAGDVLDPEILDRLIAEHGMVYHLAAAVGVKRIVADPLSSVLTNVRGTELVMAAALRHGARVLLASTSEIYGKSERSPFREDADRVLGPTWIHRWSYSTAKAIDEHLAFAYAERGLRVSVVRYFNSYGQRIDERGYGSVIARFAAQALAGESLTVHGDGLQTRCFTHVSDTVRGTMLAGESQAALGRVFNIGSSEEIRILDLANILRDMVPEAGPIVHVPYDSYYGTGFEDTRRRVPDVTLAREVLGFTAEIPLIEGLRTTLDWCRRNYAAAPRRGRSHER